MRSLLVSVGIACTCTAYAADNASESDEPALETVMVTATKRAENAQSVPITIQAISEEQLQQSGIRETQDIQLVTPGVTITNQTGGMTAFIRGIGSSDVTAGQESAVATYVDGVYQNTPYATNIPLTSVQRIEVLQGPQGTLFGRNAAGGAISIITRDPTQAPEFDANVAQGNYSTTNTSGYFTTGVTDWLATNLSASYFNRADGFGHDIVTGEPTYRDSSFSIRNKWLLTPNDATEIKIAAFYNNWRTQMGYSEQLLPGITAPDDHNTRTLPGFYDSAANSPQYGQGRSWGTSGQITLTFDHFMVRSISAFQNSKLDQYNDLDNSPASGGILNYHSLYRTTTEELQVLSTPSSPIKWVVGAFYMRDQSGFVGPFGLGLLGPDWGPVGLGLVPTIHTRASAIFGETTIPLPASTNITLGARWSQDKRMEDGYINALDPNTNAIIVATPLAPVAAKFTSPTYRAVLDHHFTDNLMTYASYNTGFKSGNFNTTSFGTPPFQPEKVQTYELGTKSEWLNHRLMVNGALFWNNYKDLQLVNYAGSAAGAAGGGVFSNAPTARSYGAELSAEAAITPIFSLMANAAYLNAKFKSYPEATCEITNPPDVGGGTDVGCDASGHYLPKAPVFTSTVSPQLHVPTRLGEVDASATWYHTTKYYNDASNFRYIPSYDMVNARIQFAPKDSNYTLAIYGNNLLNRRIINYIEVITNGDEYSAAPPMTWAAEISVKLK
jgi:iron complex outermembrane recepter protein